MWQPWFQNGIRLLVGDGQSGGFHRHGCTQTGTGAVPDSGNIERFRCAGLRLVKLATLPPPAPHSKPAVKLEILDCTFELRQDSTGFSIAAHLGRK